MGNGSEMKINNTVKTTATIIDGDLIEFGSDKFKIKLI